LGAPALTGNVEEIAVEDSRTVWTDWLDTRRSDGSPSLISFTLSLGVPGSFLCSRSESAGEDCDHADEKETDAHDEHSPIHIRSCGQGRILSFVGKPQVGILCTPTTRSREMKKVMRLAPALVLAATFLRADSASAQLFQWTPEQLIKYTKKNPRPLPGRQAEGTR